jgi:hypothetical protein
LGGGFIARQFPQPVCGLITTGLLRRAIGANFALRKKRHNILVFGTGGLMRYSMMITSMLVIAYTVPAFAQQTSVADSQTRQQAEAILTQYTDAVNNGDTAALGAVFAPNALDINPFGNT